MKTATRSGFSLLALAFLLLFGTGCDFSGEASRTVGGVDISELFAPPTSEEVEAVRSEWAERAVQVEDFDAGPTSEVELANGTFDVSIVSHAVEGVEHTGAFVMPQEGEGPLAVLVYAHGGDQGVSLQEEVFPIIEALEELGQEVMLVVPSYRSETLRYSDLSFSSEGSPSPWDRDVDDSLALLQAALEEVSRADDDRIGVMGVSRGAAVGKLMAARDDRIDAVVSFFGPTDFYGSWVQGIVEEALRGNVLPLPGVETLVEDYVLPLQEEDLTTDEVRHEMTRRSIVNFVDELPAVQLHHGEEDRVVPVSEATQLRRAMESAGREADEEGDFQYFVYPADPSYDDTDLGQHSPEALPESIERTRSFLRDHLVMPE